MKRNPHTVRDWLKRYNAYGIKGLRRNYSPGRPDEKRSAIKEHIRKILNNSPVERGYKDHVRSVPLIVYDAAAKLNLSVSKDTVIRALNSMGYSYKRPSKTVPARAPAKEEKAKKIQSMIEGIKAILSKGETEIYALDESHFSTEPYLVRGWFKKNGRHKIKTSSRRESLTFFGCLNLVTQKSYWKKSKPSDSKAFLSFLTQLNRRTSGREIAVILDNASIHKSKKTKMSLRRHKNIHLFYLPLYSPEYNPVEIFRHWIKPKVYGFSALGGISQLVSRFRKHVWHYNNKTLPNTISFNFNAYAMIL